MINSYVQDSQDISERIRSNVASHITKCRDNVIKTTVSIGVSHYTPDDTFEKLMEKADLSMYQAKSEGRNRVIYQV